MSPDPRGSMIPRGYLRCRICQLTSLAMPMCYRCAALDQDEDRIEAVHGPTTPASPSDGDDYWSELPSESLSESPSMSESPSDGDDDDSWSESPSMSDGDDGDYSESEMAEAQRIRSLVELRSTRTQEKQEPEKPVVPPDRRRRKFNLDD